MRDLKIDLLAINSSWYFAINKIHAYTSQIIVSKYLNINHKSPNNAMEDLWLIFKYLEIIICNV